MLLSCILGELSASHLLGESSGPDPGVGVATPSFALTS